MIKNKTLDENYKIVDLGELSKLIHESLPHDWDYDRDIRITARHRRQFEKLIARVYPNAYFSENPDRTHMFATAILKVK